MEADRLGGRPSRRAFVSVGAHGAERKSFPAAAAIVGAGVFFVSLAIFLAGVTAAFTILPVIGVPIEGKSLKGLDSLLSIVQMPPGVPVATVGIGAGKNAGLLAVQILAVADLKLQAALLKFKKKLAAESRAKNRNLKG